MNDLAAMNSQMEQWYNEKPTGWSDDGKLTINTGDIVFGWFVGSGNDGQRFIAIYRSHIFNLISKNNKRYNTARWCPAKSGDTSRECPNCIKGHGDVKERMSMYFYVTTILRRSLPKRPDGSPPLPQVQHNGTVYFQEDVNNFMLWETSAWKESPWSDILNLNGVYNGLHNFMFQLWAQGEGLNKRFKIMALPNTPALDASIYERANAELKPIPDILINELTQPVDWQPQQPQQVQQNPGYQQQQPTAPVVAFSPVVTAAPAFTPVATAPGIPAAAPSPVGIPTVATPPPLPANPVPANVPPAAPQSAPVAFNPTAVATPEAPATEQVFSAPLPEAPAEDTKRPMTKMF